jgi:F-type H+-transporting ATPase subunit delta
MTNRSSAARYAKALLDVGRKEGDPAEVGRDLETFVSLATGHEQLARVLVNPAIPAARKVALVGELTSRLAIDPIVGKLVALLAGRDRLVLLPALREEYRRRLLEFTNVVEAEVTSAVPLGDDAVQAIGRAIGARIGRQLALTSRVDATIIGGVVTRIGSVVYDGSVRRQLEKMKDALIGTT